MNSVLVIDDNPVVRITLKRVLEESGFGVFIAANGLQGMQAFRQHRPDVVVTDIIMPEQEGIATIRAIRNMDPHAHIIAMTGGARIGHLDFLAIATRFGAEAVLSKPFDPEDLLQAIRNMTKPS